MGNMKRIARHDAEGKEMIQLLVSLGYDLAQRRLAYNLAKSQQVISASPDLKALAEWDYLRLQQIEVIKNRLIPVASLKKEFLEDKTTLFSLKIDWKEGKKTRIKNIVSATSLLTTCTAIEECLYRGDTLKQILKTAESGVRGFTKNYEPGKVPFWVKQWEDSDYELDFMPPAFSAWANIKDS